MSVPKVGDIAAMIKASTWGIGYGDKVHLIDHDGVRENDYGQRGVTISVPAACSNMVWLDFVDRQPSFRSQFGRKKTCTRCAKKAIDRKIKAREVNA